MSAAPNLKKFVPDKEVFSLVAGYPVLLGTLNPYYVGSFTASLGTHAHLPIFPDALQLMLQIKLSEFTHRQSDKSNLSTPQFILGFGYQVFSFGNWRGIVNLGYAGLFMRATGVSSQESTSAYKSGIYGALDVAYGIGAGLSLLGRTAYTYSTLTGGNLQELSVSLGVTYDFRAFGREKELLSSEQTRRTSAQRFQEAYDEGVKAYEAKDAIESERSFKQAAAIDADHAATQDYLRKTTALKTYLNGVDLAEQGDLYGSLQTLLTVETKYPPTRAKINELRNAHRAEEAKLEKSGIRKFEKGDYAGCRADMRRVLLLNPENKNAKVYETRSEKYLRAAEKLY